MRKFLLLSLLAVTFAFCLQSQQVTGPIVASSSVSVIRERVGTVVNAGAVANDSVNDQTYFSSITNTVNLVVVPKGTFDFTSDYTLTIDRTLQIEDGGLLKPANGVTIRISGRLIAGDHQIFDESAGGRIVFSSTTKTDMIRSMWWGGDNTGTSDSVTTLRKWLYSGEGTGFSVPHYLSPGNHRCSDELVLSNRVVVFGAGDTATSAIIYDGPANTGAFKVRSGGNDVKISDLQISNGGSSGTNTFGVWLEDDCDTTVIQNVRFSSMKGGGVNSVATSTGNLYTKILNCKFLSLDNSVANGGNGLYPAAAVKTTNTFSHSLIADSEVSDCDMAFIFHGGTATNSGNITLRKIAIEACGTNGVTSTNVILGVALSELDMYDLHVENNTVQSNIKLQQCKTVTLQNCMLSSDFAGNNRVWDSLWVDNVYNVNVLNGRFNNCVTNYIRNVGSTSTIKARNVFFDLGAASPTSSDNVAARFSGTVDCDFVLVAPSRTDPSVPSNGQLWYDSANNTLDARINGATVNLSPGAVNYFVQTSDMTVANTGTETTVLGTVTGSKTLPVNTLTAGKHFRGFVRGRYSGDAVAAGTMQVKIKLGATTILDTTARTLPNNTSNELFDVEFDIICRTAGASGTVWGQGKVLVVDATELVPSIFQMVNTGTSTIDTTATQVVDITVQWGTADTDNTLTVSMAGLSAVL